MLVSRQTEITTDIEEITVQGPTKNVLLTGLSSFSLYKVEVLGFNDVGDGPLSSPVFAGVMRWSILDKFACASLLKEPWFYTLKRPPIVAFRQPAIEDKRLENVNPCVIFSLHFL